MIRNGPRYNLNATFKFSPLSWKIAENKEILNSKIDGKYRYKYMVILFNNINIIYDIPERTTAIDRTIKLPENKPTLKVVHGL